MTSDDLSDLPVAKFRIRTGAAPEQVQHLLRNAGEIGQWQIDMRDTDDDAPPDAGTMAPGRVIQMHGSQTACEADLDRSDPAWRSYLEPL